MKELAKEYKQSLSMLNVRIHELVQLKNKLQKASKKDPEKDPDIIELNDRLKPLRSMQKDTQEIATVVRKYYDRRYWRNERYTLNSRYSDRRHLFFGSIYDEASDESSGEGEDEEIFTFGYHICFDG